MDKQGIQTGIGGVFRYTAPPLTSSSSVVFRYVQNEDNRKQDDAKDRTVLHNRIDAFRRKVGL